MQLNPKSLPDIASLRRRCQSLAMLDAILCTEWDLRYFSFDTRWSENESMGSMRNGSGDDWFILFGEFGAAIKGLAHEASIAGDKVLVSEVQSQVPKAFSSFVTEPAFGMDWLSYCYWRGSIDSSWNRVIHPDPALSSSKDGSAEYLALLVEPATSYQEFAKWYHELNIPADAIESIYNHTPLSERLVSSLNPEVSLAQAKEDAAEIGYPVGDADA